MRSKNRCFLPWINDARITSYNVCYTKLLRNWNNSTFVPKRKYSAIFDIHSNIDRLSERIPEGTKKILYATGAHWLLQNHAEYQRLTELMERRGASLIPRRQTFPCQSVEKADHIIILGNQFAYQSFQYAKKPLHTIDLFSIFSMESYNFV